MAKPELHQKTEIEDKNSLKGALASVTILGIFFLVSWFAVWNLFVSR
ncbi:cytochrome c oxidase subunit 2A [Bacillus sp. Marseille-P3661]|nr:cytochrome c oxidase subunit 2A [Bacillus sp. Marseille-P3661]